MKCTVFVVLQIFALVIGVHCLSCIPNCDKSRCSKLQCVGSEVPGLCNCCNRCAKQQGERCGGDWTMFGICEPILFCQSPDYEYHGPETEPSGLPYYFYPFRFRIGTCVSTDSTCADVCASTKPKKSVGLSRSAKKGYMKSENGNKPYWVYCDCSEGEENAWMVIQRRSKNAESFDKTMDEYRSGFGYTNADFWLGLDRINKLTEKQSHEMKVIVKLENGQRLTTNFSEFAVGNRSTNYKLHVASNDDQTARRFVSVHNDMAFTTSDKDNDKWIDGNCAKKFGGGWWFMSCTDFNLNGRFRKPDPLRFRLNKRKVFSGGPAEISWGTSSNERVAAAEIWIRPTTPNFI